MPTDRKLRVFLCHAKEDKPTVRELYRQLTAEGWMDVWLDEVKLLPGQKWDIEIEKAVEQANVVVVCLSNHSVNKEGYVQKELRFVLSIADEKPEGTIFVIPLRLDDCQVPRRIQSWQYEDYFPKNNRKRAYQHLLKSLKLRATTIHVAPSKILPIEVNKKPIDLTPELNENTEPKRQTARTKLAKKKKVKAVKSPMGLAGSNAIQHSMVKRAINATVTSQPSYPNKFVIDKMEFVQVPAGKFLMGSKGKDDECPQHEVEIPYDYWIGRFPVTNAQFSEFFGEKSWWKLAGKDDHPTTWVPWQDALKYIAWLNNKFSDILPQGHVFDLPSEAEWEKAARGIDGLDWPWGAEFDENKCNSFRGGRGDTTPVGAYSPAGDSPYGTADMVGNVWEWTRSLFTSYPYKTTDHGREDENVSKIHVLRGGSFGSDPSVTSRGYPGGKRVGGEGIRVAIVPISHNFPIATRDLQPNSENFTSVGHPIYIFGDIEFVCVPKGKFVMGSVHENECPPHTVDIPYNYWIGRFPITNLQFAKFAGKDFKILKGKGDHPVMKIWWNGAQKYITWLNRRFVDQLPSGYIFRLPTEAEWEKAGRGEYGNEFPWGDAFDKDRCNSFEGGKKDTTSVGAYSPQGDSPYGVADMSGNVWEWMQSLLKPYPYDSSDGREDLTAPGERVVRGGSFNYYRTSCAQRNSGPHDLLGDGPGFRVVVAPPLPQSSPL